MQYSCWFRALRCVGPCPRPSPCPRYVRMSSAPLLTRRFPGPSNFVPIFWHSCAIIIRLSRGIQTGRKGPVGDLSGSAPSVLDGYIRETDLARS